MALKIDKEAIIEYSTKNKDTLFLGFLIFLLVAGSVVLYQKSAQSVENLIADITANPGGGGGAAGEAAAKEVLSSDVVTDILNKRAADQYNTNRTPFGSPADQLRMRQQVDDAYNKGVEMFRTGQFDQAAQQFDRVIALDATETRIQYPILPSEYKRRAQQENAKKNFDTIFQTAQTDIQEGDRLLAAGQKPEALAVYRRANENLNAVLQSDPQGEAIGKDNITKIQTLQKTGQQKLFGLWSDSINSQIAQAQQMLNGQDFIAMTRALFQLARVQMELRAADPDQTLLDKNKHNQVTSLLEQLQTKIKDNAPVLAAQAEQAFTDAIAAKDLQKSQDAITALRQAQSLTPADPALQKKIADFSSQRATLVLQSAEDFYKQQKTILDSGKYDQFDREGKVRYLADVVQLRELGAALDSATRNRIVQIETNLKALRQPSALTDAYEFSNPRYANNSLTLDYVEKNSRTAGTKPPLTLRDGRRDRATGITLKQVDTTNGFVILSKSGYLDAKVPLK